MLWDKISDDRTYQSENYRSAAEGEAFSNSPFEARTPSASTTAKIDGRYPPSSPNPFFSHTQTGLAELLSDPEAGPFTVFAPVDSSLELVPGLSTVASDKGSLEKLVRFHIGLGTLAASPSNGAATRAAAAGAAGVATPRTAAGRLFTPSLANATAEQRSALSGERFASGPRLWTLLDSDHERDADGGKAPMTISVQIAAAAAPPSPDGSAGTGGGGGVRVFLGPGGGQRQQVGGVDLFLGAFASEVVLPDMNAVNGVVHGISGVMTYPGYKKPTPRRYGR